MKRKTRHPEILIKRIVLNPEQPRKVFDETELEQLAKSIREHGVIQPIAVEECGDDYILHDELSSRFKPFHVKFPMEWELIYSFRSRCYSAAETKLHKRFADRRQTGEWFHLSGDDVAFITNIQDFELD